jgi:archaellum component FlaC
MTGADEKTAGRYMILLEQIQSQVQLIAESHEQLDRKIESVSSDLGIVKNDLSTFMRHTGERFNRIDKRLDGIDDRLDGIDIKLDRVCSKVDSHELALKNTRPLQ